MNEENIQLLNEINRLLEKLDDNIDKGEVSPYLEFTGDEKYGYVLGANTEGFVYLANLMLGLARNQKKNEHYHFDDANMLDKNTNSLTISYVKP
ncbi:MAG: hypothetical protein CR997_03805 [Acidobacteria bacterium]|nr:MAG: hypothetical protein CR997_03805 [Acidobacteriota bacterium]